MKEFQVSTSGAETTLEDALLGLSLQFTVLAISKLMCY